jgi:hypothetical protein
MGYAFVANLEISAIDLFKTADNQMYREKTQWQSESESCDK